MPKFMTKNKPREAPLFLIPSSPQLWEKGPRLLLPSLPSVPTWLLADGRRNEPPWSYRIRWA